MEKQIQTDLNTELRPAEAFDLTPFVLIIVGALVIGSIVSYPGLDYCPNDASRWNTVYYLVEKGTYAYQPDHGAAWAKPRHVDPNSLGPEKRAELVEIDGKFYPSPASVPLFWTIDMVRIDGKYYSSKPPLLPTCLAGIVWVIGKLTGAQFHQHPWFIIRTTLIIAQALPLLLCVYLLSLHVRRLTDSPFARNFSLLAVGLGTYLTPWSVTLNNHVIAACCATVSLHAAIRVWYDGRREWYWFALAGFFGTFAAANELPAALLAAVILVALARKDCRKALLFAGVAAAIPVIAFLATNKIATGSFTPAYAGFGKPGGPYDYPGSYWLNPTGMDALHEPWWVYGANILVGHHGFFLLTPIFLIGIAGIASHLRPVPAARSALAWCVLAVSATIFCFYTFWTSESRNYGGTTQGPRWMFWLIPLWLLFLPTGVERLGRMRAGRVLCCVLLAVSLFTVGFAWRQPWSAPWAHLLFRQLKWITY